MLKVDSSIANKFIIRSSSNITTIIGTRDVADGVWPLRHVQELEVQFDRFKMVPLKSELHATMSEP